MCDRAAYWEPAKWAQRLRAAMDAPTSPPAAAARGSGGGGASGDDVLVKMDLGAGHFSASDRYKYYRELSFDHAWLLDQFGLADTAPGQPGGAPTAANAPPAAAPPSPSAPRV